MVYVPVPAPLAFARLCVSGATDAHAAWASCVLPERMVIALGVLDDPRWMMRAACVVWRTVGHGSVAGTRPDRTGELGRAIDGVLSAYETWADGGALDPVAVGAKLDAIETEMAPGPVAWGLRTLLELVLDPHDAARDLHAVACVETAVEVALDSGAPDRTAVRAELASAIRAALDPFPALAATTHTIELQSEDHEDPLPF